MDQPWTDTDLNVITSPTLSPSKHFESESESKTLITFKLFKGFYRKSSKTF